MRISSVLLAGLGSPRRATKAGVVAQGFIPASVLGNRGACDPQQLAAGLRASQAMRNHRQS
jgi:hypothetical protein